MPWNNTAMQLAANALRTASAYMQLHSADAGSSYTSNVTSAGRQPIVWGAASGNGDFGLSSPVAFTGGAPNTPVYSATMWSGSSGGTCYGQFPLAGDNAFNASGQYNVTAIDLDGNAT